MTKSILLKEAQRKGGLNRVKNTTRKQRIEWAKLAAKARWDKYYEKRKNLPDLS